jgi:hypothetical protein
LDALRRDRDQLWAEAAAAEASGESLVIEDHLCQAAATQQEERMLKDPWDDILAEVKGDLNDKDSEERISSERLIRDHLQLKADRIKRRNNQAPWSLHAPARLVGRQEAALWVDYETRILAEKPLDLAVLFRAHGGIVPGNGSSL